MLQTLLLLVPLENTGALYYMDSLRETLINRKVQNINGAVVPFRVNPSLRKLLHINIAYTFLFETLIDKNKQNCTDISNAEHLGDSFYCQVHHVLH